MCMLNGMAYRDNQRESLAGCKLMLVTVFGDRNAFYEFHNEVRASASSFTAIEHARDVRVLHYREGLPLGLKPRDHLASVHARLKDLERDGAPNRMLLFGCVDDAKAAVADMLEQLVRSNQRARAFDRRAVWAGIIGRSCDRRLIEEIIRPLAS